MRRPRQCLLNGQAIGDVDFSGGEVEVHKFSFLFVLSGASVHQVKSKDISHGNLLETWRFDCGLGLRLASAQRGLNDRETRRSNRLPNAADFFIGQMQRDSFQ